MLDEQEAAAAKVLLRPRVWGLGGGSRAARTQDTWYPAHRNCSCCKGYIHGAAKRAPQQRFMVLTPHAQLARRRCARSWGFAAARWKTPIFRRVVALACSFLRWRLRTSHRLLAMPRHELLA